jgi:hypothetical protein
MKTEIKIPLSELETLLLCSVRYSLPRQTYVTGEVADLVALYINQLSKQTRDIIIRDINRDIQEGLVKSDIDLEIWLALKEKLEKLNG